MSENLRSSAEDLKVVEPHWPPLADDELHRLLQHYPHLGAFCERLTVSMRPLSAASLVRTEQAVVFVKRQHPRTRSVDDLEREHRFIAHLKQRGVPVPGIYATAAGHTVVTMDDWRYEVQEAAEGEDSYGAKHTWSPFFSRAQAYSAGRAMAQLHQAAADFPLREPRPHRPMTAQFELANAPDLVAAIAASLHDRPRLREFLERRPWQAAIEQAHGPFQRQLAPQLASLPRWYTHGDWQANNLFYRGDEVSAIIDFHLADYTYRLYDVVVGIERNTLLWLSILEGDHSAVRYDLIEAFLQGYESLQPLTPAEYRALPDMLPIVQLDFSLSGIDYYWGVEGSETRGAWGYDVFLVAHTRWFHTPAGQTLLGFLAARGERKAQSAHDLVQ